MNKKFDIIIIWYQNDWGLFSRRNENFARSLLSDDSVRRVVHIEPPINLDEFNPESTVFEDNSATNKRRINGYFDNGVLTFTPSYSGKLDQNNISNIMRQIDTFLFVNEIKKFVLWIYPPSYMADLMLSQYGDKAITIISDIVDDHRKYHDDINRVNQIDQMYSRAIKRSDIVLTVSEKMRNEFYKYNKDIYHVRNAISSKYTDMETSLQKPTLFEEISGPIIGYAGALSFRIDTELLRFIAEERPDWNLVLIGTSPNYEIQKLGEMNNVYLLPPVKHSELLCYTSFFDACIIPHIVDDVTSSMDPLKVYDYLASGKPIISTPVQGIEYFDGIVEVQSDFAKFLRAISDSLNAPRLDDQYIKVLSENTWDNRVEFVLSLIREKFDQQNNSVNNYYELPRPEIQSVVNPRSRRILDVGCGGGRMASELKQKLGAEVWGVELNEDMASKASRKIDKVFSGPIEKFIDQVPEKYFDTIIFADVLEHMVNPEKVLLAIKGKLSKDGDIIASIPNVRHWSVLRDLLQGRWDYRDAGILDKTHLRFFTRDSIVKMFNKAGFSIVGLRATIVDPGEIGADLINSLFSYGLDVSTLKEESKHYQYIVNVKMD